MKKRIYKEKPAKSKIKKMTQAKNQGIPLTVSSKQTVQAKVRDIKKMKKEKSINS